MAEQVKETHQRPGPDDKQKAAILCLDNAVVSAGAGSGKTFVLTERFFKLVESGKAEVDEILTLTFTKKAASEMFERIYLRLLRSREGSELLREQVRKFDQAQISTLDSFCAQIARAGAGLFGMSPDFSIDDSGAADCAEQTALKYLLRRSNNPVLQEYIVNYSFERVWKHFFAVYGYKYISVALKTDYGEMEKKQKLYLETQFQHHANKMLSAGRYILSLDENAGKAVLTNQKALSCFPELSDAVAAKNFKTVLALCDSIALSKAGVSQSKKQELADLGNYIDEFREQQKNVNIIADTLTSWDINREVFNLLQEYEQELRDEKRRLGLCSYYDVLSLATETLKKDKALREYFKSVFRYIMIDEFQDNNGMQKQLLYLLAEKKGLFNEKPSAEDLEEGKLFFVGDDKQSIYRFRGADVSVFKALRNELAGNAGSHIEMEKNYRSNPGLIDFYNYLFRSVFSGGNDPAPYEAGFLPLKAGGGGPQVLPEINILYKPFDAEEDTGRFASGDETEAYYLAEYIKSRVEGKTLPVRDGTVLRPAVYSDFALLMRSTGSQAVYERIFRQFGIPYSSDNVRTLFLEAPLNDFYSILQLAVFPSDKTAYAAYLRSPLLGCSDETMLKLLLIADEENGPFSENADGIEMTKTDRERYTKGKELFLFLRKNIGTMPIGKIVQHIWFDRGYRYLLMTNRAYHPYLEYYDYLYYLAVDADRRGQTVTEFLDFMRRNLGKYERLEDFDNLKEAAEGVQILTIHKSKGLEFPVVLLANTGNAGSKSGGPELFYVSPEYGLTFSGSGTGGSRENYFYTLMADENKKMETAELKRLLYVACTRAKDHLIISGYHHRNNRNDDGAMLNMILHAAGISDVSGEHAAGGKAVFRRMSPLLKNRVRYRLAADTENVEEKINAYLRRPVLQFSIDRRDFSVTEIAEYQHVSDGEGGQAELPVFEWEKEWEDTAAEEGFSASVGTLAHCIIEQKITGTYGPASIPELYLKAFPAALRPRIISSLEEVTEGFFSSPLGEQLRRARRFETEYDFVSRYLSGGKEYFIYGRMDLFFETETSAYVIDFKTDRVIVPAVHDTQLQLYGKAAASLSGKTPECRLFFLRDGTVRVVKPDPAFVPLFPRAAADTAVWR